MDENLSEMRIVSWDSSMVEFLGSLLQAVSQDSHRKVVVSNPLLNISFYLMLIEAKVLIDSAKLHTYLNRTMCLF